MWQAFYSFVAGLFSSISLKFSHVRGHLALELFVFPIKMRKTKEDGGNKDEVCIW